MIVVTKSYFNPIDIRVMLRRKRTLLHAIQLMSSACTVMDKVQ